MCEELGCSLAGSSGSGLLMRYSPAAVGWTGTSQDPVISSLTLSWEARCLMDCWVEGLAPNRTVWTSSQGRPWGQGSEKDREREQVPRKEISLCLTYSWT